MDNPKLEFEDYILFMIQIDFGNGIYAPAKVGALLCLLVIEIMYQHKLFAQPTFEYKLALLREHEGQLFWRYMQLIPLTQGLYTLVDDEDYERYGHLSWHANVKTNGHVYATHSIHVNDERNKVLRLHREIAGAKPGQIVDHIDGNGLNNLRSNLRVCTNQQNLRNQKRRSNNTSGYKGVSWNKQYASWVVNIRYQYQHVYLGAFSDPHEAAYVYDQFAVQLFGEYARLNLL